MKFAILGQGVYGEALGRILRENGHATEFFDPYKGTKPLTEVLTDADAVLIATPYQALAALLPELKTALTPSEAPADHPQAPQKHPAEPPQTPQIPLIIATKGILDPTIFHDFTDVIALSGPGFAEDLNQEKSTALSITDPRLQDWFGRPWLTLAYTPDQTGVFLCGALKNVYALEAGRRQLAPGSPELDQYVKKATAELATILERNHADPRTATQPCGIDDLRLTCTPHSRNYTYGQKLARDPDARPEGTIEGLAALAQIRDNIITIPANAQLLNHIKEETWN